MPRRWLSPGAKVASIGPVIAFRRRALWLGAVAVTNVSAILCLQFSPTALNMHRCRQFRRAPCARPMPHRVGGSERHLQEHTAVHLTLVLADRGGEEAELEAVSRVRTPRTSDNRPRGVRHRRSLNVRPQDSEGRN